MTPQELADELESQPGVRHVKNTADDDGPKLSSVDAVAYLADDATLSPPPSLDRDARVVHVSNLGDDTLVYYALRGDA